MVSSALQGGSVRAVVMAVIMPVRRYPGKSFCGADVTVGRGHGVLAPRELAKRVRLVGETGRRGAAAGLHAAAGFDRDLSGTVSAGATVTGPTVRASVPGLARPVLALACAVGGRGSRAMPRRRRLPR